MANTFVKIQTITVGVSGASTISFTSIPQTYTDLKLVLSGRVSAANFYANAIVSINNQSSGNWRTVYGNANTTASGNATVLYAPIVGGATSTGSVFGNAEMYFSNYTSSNVKSISVDAVVENNSSTAYILGFDAVSITNGQAITAITITQDFVQYSSATLYGIKNT